MLHPPSDLQSGPVAPVPPSAGTVTVPVEVAALASYIVAVGYIDPPALSALVTELGLGAVVSFDPEVHGAEEGLLPGDSYIAFSAAFRDVIRAGNPHLRIFAGKLN